MTWLRHTDNYSILKSYIYNRSKVFKKLEHSTKIAWDKSLKMTLIIMNINSQKERLLGQIWRFLFVSNVHCLLNWMLSEPSCILCLLAVWSALGEGWDFLSTFHTKLAYLIEAACLYSTPRSLKREMNSSKWGKTLIWTHCLICLF